MFISNTHIHNLHSVIAAPHLKCMNMLDTHISISATAK